MDTGGSYWIYCTSCRDETDGKKTVAKLKPKGTEPHSEVWSGCFGYPVRQEELPLGSEEVGQVPVLAEFHHHHQRTWRSRRFLEWWRCSSTRAGSSSSSFTHRLLWCRLPTG